MKKARTKLFQLLIVLCSALLKIVAFYFLVCISIMTA